MKKEYITHTPKETEKLGYTLARTVKNGRSFALVGNLGSGKTVFTKGFARGLGILDVIQSPTFVVMNVYPIHKENVTSFAHVDCYRIDSIDELQGIGIEDYFNASSLVVIEWADKITSLLPNDVVNITFDIVSETERKIIISGL